MCDLYLDGDFCKVWTQTRRKAAKEHRCQCCGTRICRGERYLVTKSLFDGEWSTEKMCRKCDGIQKAFGEEHRYYPGPFELDEYLDQCIDEGDGDVRRWKRYRRAISQRRQQAREALAS